MVNLLITMRCNRSCSYCFAKEKLHEYSCSEAVTDIDLENVNIVLKFLKKTRANVIQLAGGEPTIHPKFKQILEILINSNMNVNILSNALWNPKFNELFAKISPTRLGFLLNIDHPRKYTESEWGRLMENLSLIAKRGNVTLSFNIFERKPDYEYIFELVSNYGFKHLRLSFSMPISFDKRTNTFLQIEDYKAASKYVIDFVRKGEALGAETGLDNTVPICMFTPEELSELLLKQVIVPSRNFVCYPAIDIGPDLSVWRCFGTSKVFNKKLNDFNSLDEVYEYYQRVSRLYQFKYYPMKECETCEHAKSERCQGGCIGFAIAQCENMGKKVEEESEDDLLKMKPMLVNRVTLHRYQLPRETLIISLQDGSQIEIPKLMIDLLEYFDGERTVSEVIEEKTQSIFRSKEDDPVDDFLKDVLVQELIPIIRLLLEKNVISNKKVANQEFS